MEECQLDEFNAKVCPDSAVSDFFIFLYYIKLILVNPIFGYI